MWAVKGNRVREGGEEKGEKAEGRKGRGKGGEGRKGLYTIHNLTNALPWARAAHFSTSRSSAAIFIKVKLRALQPLVNFKNMLQTGKQNYAPF